MNIKKGDTVKLLTGDKKDRQKTGKVLEVSPKEGKVIEAESAVYACKVQVVCPKCKKPTRIGHKIYADGKKDRMCRKCGETF